MPRLISTLRKNDANPIAVTKVLNPNVLDAVIEKLTKAKKNDYT